MLFHLPAADFLPGFQIDHSHGRLRPERHVEPAAGLIEHAGIREGQAGVGVFQQLLGPLGERPFAGTVIGGWVGAGQRGQCGR